MKKILLLAPPNSIHTIKWANEISAKGLQVVVFGLGLRKNSLYNNQVKVHYFPVPERFINLHFGSFIKLYYFFCIPSLLLLIFRYKPDLIHAHYASSYGIIGSLINKHPFLVSVWGDDVYSFPKQSEIHRKVFKWTLGRADKILSTSSFMANEIRKYTSKHIEVTPFGVDTHKFCNFNGRDDNSDKIVIGIIKGLEFQYGIEYLISAFNNLLKRNPKLNLELLIVGGGSLQSKFLEMVNSSGISEKVVFTGQVDNSQTPNYHNMIDIFVSLSVESFGVSIVEAQACEVPVVVANDGGAPEVIRDGITGFSINREDEATVIEYLEKLIYDKNLRIEMGKKGREFVLSNFEIEITVKKMLNVYNEILGEL